MEENKYTDILKKRLENILDIPAYIEKYYFMTSYSFYQSLSWIYLFIFIV